MQQPQKLLFVINPVSGSHNIDWSAEIDAFFSSLPYTIEKFLLPQNFSVANVKDKISDAKPNKVIAVGGDGTIKLVAECILHTDIILGILPAGSANGLAKELGVPLTVQAALEHILKEETQQVHLVKINNHLCVHLSDLGFNASVIKIFEAENRRGMWGYVKAAWKVLWKHSLMQATIRIDNNHIRRDAAMIVIANATRYGSGAIINPLGRLDDDLFEIVIIKKISFSEIFKMIFSHKPYDKTKTEVFQAQSVKIHSRKKVHFQVDGEYFGKVNNVEASLIAHAIKIVK